MGLCGWSQGRDSLAAPRVNGERAAQAVEGHGGCQGLAGLATFDSSRQKLVSAVWLGIETRLCHGKCHLLRERSQEASSTAGSSCVSYFSC